MINVTDWILIPRYCSDYGTVIRREEVYEDPKIKLAKAGSNKVAVRMKLWGEKSLSIILNIHIHIHIEVASAVSSLRWLWWWCKQLQYDNSWFLASDNISCLSFKVKEAVCSEPTALWIHVVLTTQDFIKPYLLFVNLISLCLL